MSSEILEHWFSQQRSRPAVDYEHLLLRQENHRQWDKHFESIKAYFETAHMDARQYFHENAGICLHPLENKLEAKKNYCYPNDLDETTKAGFFGEVMNAFLIEHAGIMGKGQWQVPVFLFRFHQDVENHIHELNQGIVRRSRTLGRLGNDCLGIVVDENSKVVGIITGESKFRKSLSEAEGEELNSKVHHGFCNEADAPVNLMKFARLLEKKDAKLYQETITSLEAINKRQKTVTERQHIYSLIVCKTKKQYPPTYISQTKKHEKYKIKRPLQCVEIILPDGKTLITELYSSLYSSNEDLTHA
jgi:hypothetical protein